jgi:putative MATE family efflux protein
MVSTEFSNIQIFFKAQNFSRTMPNFFPRQKQELLYLCTLMKNAGITQHLISKKTILLIALPIILESLAQNVLNITDTAFMGRMGEINLGAAAIGSLFYFVFIMIAFGLGVGAQIIIARRFGEGNLKMIGKTLMQTQYLMLTFAILVLVSSRIFLPEILDGIVASEPVREKAFDYLSFRLFGFIPAFLNASFRSFYVGIARTKVIIYTTIIMTIVNVLFNYFLIFGTCGFPELGISGAAIASVLAESCALVYFIIYTRLKVNNDKYRLFQFTPLNFPLIKRILRIASPLMLQYFVSLTCWFSFFLLIEKMGETQLAISNLIRSLYILMCLPIWGFSAVTNTLVSQLLGKGRSEQVMGMIPKVLSICLPVTLIITAFLAIFARQVLMVLTNDSMLIEQTLPVFYIILGAAPLLAIGIITFSALTGTGKTVTGMIIEISILVVYVFFTWFVIKKLHWNLAAAWTVEYLYAILLGAISFLYMKSGKWKKSEV